MVEHMFDTMVDVGVDDPAVWINDNVDWVPENLEQIPPGAVLAAMLDEINIDTCTGYQRVQVLQARQRQVAHYQAQALQAITAIIDTFRDHYDDDGLVDEAAVAGSAEVAAALHLTRTAADSETSLALALQHRLTRVRDALGDGAIDVRRAKVMVADTMHLTVATARTVIDMVLPDAGLLTTGQLKAKLRKLCVATDPDEAKDRYEHAVEDRRVVVEANSDGTANLLALNLAPDEAVAAKNRIHHIALDLKRHGDKRTMDQIRSDILVDLLLGTGGYDPNSSLHLTGELTALAGLNDNPGELAGYGPVIADIARQVANQLTDGDWSYTITHHGQPVVSGTTKRRPTAAQKRGVLARWRTCIHPGCRMPATEADIDHRIPWTQQHRTQTKDLYPLCRYHHNLKTRHGWTYQPLHNGQLQFTSPLGHTYQTSGRSP